MIKYWLFIKDESEKDWSLGLLAYSFYDIEKAIYEYINLGFKLCNMIVYECSPTQTKYRIKQCVDGKWKNTRFINPLDDEWKFFVEVYGYNHISDYWKFHQLEQEWYEFEESTSIEEWVLRNESSIRDFIIWLWEVDELPFFA